MCNIHDAQSQVEGIPGRVIVLHLARDLSMADALSQIRTEYRLTVREQQALEGVLLGLTSKEVAERMSISPNTVKAFLRMVMGKMGVTSRTGLVAKLFEPNGRG
jgi:DNA-binding CsgD family transcriptional regulator